VWHGLEGSHLEAPEVRELLALLQMLTSNFAEIRLSRAHAWVAIKSRKHQVRKVYAANTDGSDLLFIANVEMGLRNGKVVVGEFVGRVIVSETESDQPKLNLYQVWGDTSALVEALRG
jgi:hypothetical protein